MALKLGWMLVNANIVTEAQLQEICAVADKIIATSVGATHEGDGL